MKNLTEPLEFDVANPWPVAHGFVDAVLTINLLHLISKASVFHLFHQARAALSEKGLIIVYGPFLRGAEYASEGDHSFDTALRSRDPAIGYKSVEAVSDIAMANAFTQVAIDEMPANNLLLTYANS